MSENKLLRALSSLFGKGQAEGADLNPEENTTYIKKLHSYILTLKAYTGDPATCERLYSLSEAVRTSDPVSHPSLAELEETISRKVRALAGNLANPLEAAKLFDELEKLLAERNGKCEALGQMDAPEDDL